MLKTGCAICGKSSRRVFESYEKFLLGARGHGDFAKRGDVEVEREHFSMLMPTIQLRLPHPTGLLLTANQFEERSYTGHVNRVLQLDWSNAAGSLGWRRNGQRTSTPTSSACPSSRRWLVVYLHLDATVVSSSRHLLHLCLHLVFSRILRYQL